MHDRKTFRDGAFLLVDGCRRTEGILTRDNYARNGVLLRPRFRRLISRLFDGPLTMIEARTFFGTQNAQDSVFYEVNKAFREVHGKPAVCRTFVDGRSGVNGLFWVWHLNSELFDAPPVRLVPGEHLKLFDLLSLAEAAAVRFLLENPYSTIGQVASAVKTRENETLSSRAIALLYEVNKKMRRLGLPDAFKKTHFAPHLYRVNPVLVRLFGETTGKPKISRNAFLEVELKIIDFLAKHQGSTSAQISEALEIGQLVFLKMNSIKKKAALFGLQAFEEKQLDGKTRRYSLAKEFAEALGLAPSAADVTRLFKECDLPVLKFIIENPCASSCDMRKALGYDRQLVHEKTARVRRACAEFEVKGLVQLCGMPMRFYATEAFARPFVDAFSWNFKPVQPEDLLSSSPRMRMVYRFFSRRPRATIEDAVKTLRLKRKRVVHLRAACSKVLEAHGFPRLPSLEYASPYRDVAKASDALVAYRMKRGMWPSPRSTDLAGLDRGVCQALELHHCGVKKTVRELRKDDGVASRIARADFERFDALIASGKIDFSKFVARDERGRVIDERKTVERAARYAIARGVEFHELVKLLKKNSGWSEVIEAINDLIIASTDPSVEDDKYLARAACG